MSSPWEPAISQAMQRHGGSNRSVPKTANTKLIPKEKPSGTASSKLKKNPTPEVKPERS